MLGKPLGVFTAFLSTEPSLSVSGLHHTHHQCIKSSALISCHLREHQHCSCSLLLSSLKPGHSCFLVSHLCRELSQHPLQAQPPSSRGFERAVQTMVTGPFSFRFMFSKSSHLRHRLNYYLWSRDSPPCLSSPRSNQMSDMSAQLLLFSCMQAFNSAYRD